MTRGLQVGALFLLSIAPVVCAQNRGSGPPPARKSGKARANNPGNPIARFLQMSPEDRERALQKLPPERQAQIRQRLQQFDNLPAQRQERLIERYEIFSSLPPGKQEIVRRQIRAFNALPPGRRRLVAMAFQRLQRMAENERQERLASDAFKQRFSPDEQQILSDLTNNWPGPLN